MNFMTLKHWEKTQKKVYGRVQRPKLTLKTCLEQKKFSEKMVWESKSDENFENFEFLKIVVRRLHDMNKQT